MNRLHQWIDTGRNAMFQTLAQGATPLARYAILAMLARVLVAREMDRCALYLASSLVLANLCDLGINVACIKFSAGAMEGRLHTQRRLFCARVILAAVVALSAVALATPVAVDVLHRPADSGVLCLAAGSAALGAIASFTLAILQSERRFSRVAAVAGISAALQIAPVALAASGKISGLGLLVAADLLGKAAVIAANFGVLSRLFQAGPLPKAAAWSEMLGFARWIGLSMAVGAFSNYIPTLALARSGSEASLSTYLLGAGLAGCIALPVQAVSAVLLPEAMEARGRNGRAEYLKAWLPLTAVPALLAAPLLWFLAPWLGALIGPRYAASVGVFRILALGQLSLLVVNPVQFLLYSLNRPALCFAGDAFIAGTFGVLAFLPFAGPESVARSLLAAQSLGKLLILAATLRLSLARSAVLLAPAAAASGVAV
jgi:O-antigen/teichoic acid export membrane protein